MCGGLVPTSVKSKHTHNVNEGGLNKPMEGVYGYQVINQFQCYVAKITKFMDSASSLIPLNRQLRIDLLEWLVNHTITSPCKAGKRIRVIPIQEHR